MSIYNDISGNYTIILVRLGLFLIKQTIVFDFTHNVNTMENNLINDYQCKNTK